MTISKTLLDNATASGKPLMVRERVGGEPFALTVDSYDRRMVRGSYLSGGKRYAATFHRADLTAEIATHDKPLAAAGLTSYRYRGGYGWIMIGATDTADALREANRSLCQGEASVDRLQIFDAAAGRYVEVTA